jgi:hypothetical protein
MNHKEWDRRRPPPEDFVRRWDVRFNSSDWDKPYSAHWYRQAIVTLPDGKTITYIGDSGPDISCATIEELREKIAEYDSRAADGWSQAAALRRELNQEEK